MPIKIFNSKQALNEAAVNFDELIEITDELREKIQHTLLEMYDDLKKVCDEYGITLFLIGGTALGAVRHKGFIPWDDDFDLAFSRNDYLKFRDIFEQSELNENYILNAPNYSEHPKARFPQLIKRGTLFEEINDSSEDPELRGFKIDIFCIDDVPNNIIARTLKGMRCIVLEFIAAKVQDVENQNNSFKELERRAGKGVYYVNRAIGKVFSIVHSDIWLNRVDRCIQKEYPNSKYCSTATGRRHYFGEMLPRETFYPATEVEFCNRAAVTVHNPDKYLRNLYGDYMTIPSEEKRERHFIKNIEFGDDNE